MPAHRYPSNSITMSNHAKCNLHINRDTDYSKGNYTCSKFVLNP